MYVCVHDVCVMHVRIMYDACMYARMMFVFCMYDGCMFVYIYVWMYDVSIYVCMYACITDTYLFLLIDISTKWDDNGNVTIAHVNRNPEVGEGVGVL